MRKESLLVNKNFYRAPKFHSLWCVTVPRVERLEPARHVHDAHAWRTVLSEAAQTAEPFARHCAVVS